MEMYILDDQALYYLHYYIISSLMPQKAQLIYHVCHRKGLVDCFASKTAGCRVRDELEEKKTAGYVLVRW